jgi:DNA polymerase-3 subunit alpha
MVTRIRTLMTKNGNQMAFATIEDVQGSIELVLFPKVWEKMGALVKMESVILVEGRVDAENSEPKVLVDVVTPLSEADLQSYSDSNKDPDEPEPGTGASWQTDIDTARFIQYNDGYEEPPLSPEETSWQPAPSHSITETRSVSEESFTTGTRHAETSGTARAVSPPVVETTPSKPVVEEFIKPPVIMAPLPSFLHLGEKSEVRLVTVTIKSSGEKERDMRRIRRVHGVINSFPGRDRFCFLVYEHGYRHLLDFPNNTTNASGELINQLCELVGKENIQVENI